MCGVREGNLKPSTGLYLSKDPEKALDSRSLLLLNIMHESPGDLVKMGILIHQVWVEPRGCISNQLPRDADSAVPRTNFEQQRYRGHFPVIQGRGPQTLKETARICILKP